MQKLVSLFVFDIARIKYEGSINENHTRPCKVITCITLNLEKVEPTAISRTNGKGFYPDNIRLILLHLYRTCIIIHRHPHTEAWIRACIMPWPNSPVPRWQDPAATRGFLPSSFQVLVVWGWSQVAMGDMRMIQTVRMTR